MDKAYLLSFKNRSKSIGLGFLSDDSGEGILSFSKGTGTMKSLFTQHKCGHQFTSVSLCFDTTIKGFHFIKSLINWDRLVFFPLCNLSFMAHLCSLDALMESQKGLKDFTSNCSGPVQTRNQGQSLFLHSSRPCGIPGP